MSHMERPLGFLVLLGALAAPLRQAVPSFARQTGMTCEACHTVFPELNHFGRMFKANGYTIDNFRPVRGITATREEMLALSGLPPISAMVQVSETNLSKNLPDGTDLGTSQSGTAGVPQQMSLFYAGKIAPGVGAFVQLTYSNDCGTIGIDNVDLRWSEPHGRGRPQPHLRPQRSTIIPRCRICGTARPHLAFPTPPPMPVLAIAGTQIDGTLGQDVAGLSAYVMWDESLYVELGVYRSAKQGAANGVTDETGPLDGGSSNVIIGAPRTIGWLTNTSGLSIRCPWACTAPLSSCCRAPTMADRIHSADPTTSSRTTRSTSSTNTLGSGTCLPWPARASRRT